MRVQVLLLCFVAACHNNSGMRASPDEGWSYDTQTAEEQEERARRLSQCLLAEPDTAQWIRHTTDIGVRVSLPPQYQSAKAIAAEQQSWEDDGGSTFLLTRHAGDGGAKTMIFFSEEPTRVAERQHCRVNLLGRDASLFLQTVTYGERQFFYASTDVGIHTGFGIGVAILSKNYQERAVLIAALRTIHMRD